MKKTLLAVSLTLLALGCTPNRDPIDPQITSSVTGQDNTQSFDAINAANDAAGATSQRSIDADQEIEESEANNEAVASGPLITVHKTATCGCCSAWVDHLRNENFEVKVIDHHNLGQVKKELGVPQHLHSCHTGEINGLFVEGHVPAEDILEMLNLAKQDEAIDGIAVPGMPMGSPGMEAGGQVQPYDVIMVSGEEESVLNSHGKR